MVFITACKTDFGINKKGDEVFFFEKNKGVKIFFRLKNGDEDVFSGKIFLKPGLIRLIMTGLLFINISIDKVKVRYCYN